jgi:hypothetical protein
MSVDEFPLMLWCEFDHTEAVTGVERRENAIVDSEIRVTHVGAFEHPVQRQYHAPEIICLHLGYP